ncbi:unnamed protein product [Dovyalis caffra]|uniref:NAC domain-containing protein n=1 Tax=Dovyalis caffra TaxID=77055 RepID=A0AAV1SQT8_9ROSI|nr:unnamed protein product [Dovyalis caffra]
MYEYRLEEKELADKGIAQDGYVLCVIFQKEGPGPKNGAQYGAPFNEDEWDDDDDDETEDEVNVQQAIFSAVMHAPALTLPNNPNTSMATSSHVPESTCTGPPKSCPSQAPAIACTTLPMVSYNDVASAEAPQVVQENVNGGEADSSAGMSTPVSQQPCNKNGSIHARSSSYVPENTCYSTYIPSMDAPQVEATQIMDDDDDDILSMLAIFGNDNTEAVAKLTYVNLSNGFISYGLGFISSWDLGNHETKFSCVFVLGFCSSVDFGGTAEPEADIYQNLGDLANLEGGNNVPISQYFMDPTLPGSNMDFLELMDLDTPLNQRLMQSTNPSISILQAFTDKEIPRVIISPDT